MIVSIPRPWVAQGLFFVDAKRRADASRDAKWAMQQLASPARCFYSNPSVRAVW